MPISLEQHFSFLDQLPDALYDTIITHTHGQLETRVQGILQWKTALLAGQLPDAQHLLWPEEKICHTLLERLASTEIVQYCQQQEALTHQVLLDICAAVSSIERLREQHLEQLFEQLRQQPSQHHNKETSPSPTSTSPTDKIDPTQQQIILLASQQFEQYWTAWAKEWAMVENTFKTLGNYIGEGWDLSQGILQYYPWKDIVHYRQIIQQQPQLQHIIQLLGRMRKTDTPEYSLAKNVVQPLQPPHPDPKEISDMSHKYSIPHSTPMQTQGITRSDDIARMLPVESSLLGHPQLHYLWHAKRAEQNLLSYQVQGVLSEHRIIPQAAESKPCSSKNRQQKKTKKSTIIVCLDSSASMQGEAEYLAKGLTLEIMSVAHQAQRPCYLYSFSGTDQILTHHLQLSNAGIQQLLEFLTHSFQGGTNVELVLQHALRKIQQQIWQDADILLISDGRFMLLNKTLHAIQSAQQQYDIRIHGVLIGHWQGTIMQQICQPLHTIQLANR